VSAGSNSVGHASTAGTSARGVRWFTSRSRIRVLAEKRLVRLDELDLSPRLYSVLWRHGYAVLGDLEGLTLAKLTVHRGFGPRCERELRGLLVDRGILVRPVQPRRSARPPAEAARLGLDDRATHEQAARVRDATQSLSTTTLLRLRQSRRIVVPSDRSEAALEELPISIALRAALVENRYAVLGDLQGLSFQQLAEERGFARGCLRELHDLLMELGILPMSAALQIPAFAMDYRIEELPLSPRSSMRLRRAGFDALAELHGSPVSDLRRAGVAASTELLALVETMTASGPPAPRGLLDALDAGLDALTEHRRRVLLLRFGGAGDRPLSLGETAHRSDGGSREWVRQVQKRALAGVRVVAGPEFGRSLRELERGVSAGSVDLRDELSRIGRPGDNLPFYERLLVALAPGLARRLESA